VPDYPIVRLKIKRNVPYPLVWRRMVASAPAVEPGACVTVLDREGSCVGHGFYCPTSQIAVRLLSSDPGEHIDEAFLARRVRTAAALRHDVLELGRRPRDAYRVVNAEGDGLSGLILDRFGELIVGEILSVGFFRRLEELRAALEETFPGCTVHFRADPDIQQKEGFELNEPVPAPAEIEEHGISFLVDPSVGHKTGFFLDQRENRLRLRTFAAGRRVLDVCCFTGGFSLNAAEAGAREVTGLDLDEKAVALAARNAARNRLAARFVHVDAFGYLRDMARNEKTVDVVILDPAKLARTREEVPDALRTHFDLHRTVLPVLAPNGLLVTCSCSALVSEEPFLATLRKAGRRTGREVRVLSLTGPSPDHPYSLHFPEGRYLNVAWASVV
jgi:23S rRNA (cytosine1962-C5)-methyltransferase